MLSLTLEMHQIDVKIITFCALLILWAALLSLAFCWRNETQGKEGNINTQSYANDIMAIMSMFLPKREPCQELKLSSKSSLSACSGLPNLWKSISFFLL